ncbi:MAG: ParA family protein, partial [Vicinamibacteria bacterium]
MLDDVQDGVAEVAADDGSHAVRPERGRRVLAIDMDPQASLTMATGVDIAALPASVYDLLLDDSLDLPSLAVPTSIAGVELVHPDDGDLPLFA